jgi:sugar phosphate isomerase/epimerase
MRLCCNDTGINVTGDVAQNEEQLKQLNAIGFRVFGLGVAQNANDDQIARMKDLAAKYDMVIGMSPTGYQVAHPDPAQRLQEQENLKKSLKNMQKLGGETIHVAGGSYSGDAWWHHPKNFTQQGLDELIVEMKKMVPYAEDAGVAICPETTQWCILNSLERMKEYVDRIDSPCVKVTFDVVNHMRPDRIYESGRFFRCALALLGDRIGMLHVKDALPQSGLVVHINEAPMGTGLLDHETIIKASKDLEPWKLFSLEHFNERDVPTAQQWEKNYQHIQGIANRIGHQWTNPRCTRTLWQKGEYK